MSKRIAVASEELRQLLKQEGFKITPARVAVMALLRRTRKPLTVEDIMWRLPKKSFDLATIYRSLATLRQTGLVRQIDFQQGRALYELADQAEHHHVICTRCESMEDVRDLCTETMEQRALQQSGFAAITQHSLEFFGLCKRCASQTR